MNFVNIDISDREIVIDIDTFIKMALRKEGNLFVYDYENLFFQDISPFDIYKDGKYLTTIFTLKDFFTEWGYNIFKEINDSGYLAFKVEKNTYPTIKKILGKMGFNELSESPSFLYVGFSGIIEDEEDQDQNNDQDNITYYIPKQELDRIDQLLTYQREYGYFFKMIRQGQEIKLILERTDDDDSEIKSFDLINGDPCALAFDIQQNTMGLISWHTHPQSCGDADKTNFGSLFSPEDIISYFEKSSISDFVFAHEGIYVADKKKLFYKLLTDYNNRKLIELILKHFDNFYSFNFDRIMTGMECISVIYGLGVNYGKKYHTNPIYASTLLLFFLQNETLLNSLYFLLNPQETYDNYSSKVEEINQMIEKGPEFGKYQEFLLKKKRKQTQREEREDEDGDEKNDLKKIRLRYPYDYFFFKIGDVFDKEVMDKIYALFNITHMDDLKKMYSFCLIALLETSPNKFLPEELVKTLPADLTSVFSEEEIKEFMSSSMLDIHLYQRGDKHNKNNKNNKHFDELGFRSYKYPIK